MRFDTGRKLDDALASWVVASSGGSGSAPRRATSCTTTGVKSTAVASRLMSTVTSTATAETAITSRRDVWPRSPIHVPAASNRPASRATSASTNTAARNASVGARRSRVSPTSSIVDESRATTTHRAEPGDQEVGHASPRHQHEHRDQHDQARRGPHVATPYPMTRCARQVAMANGPETWSRCSGAASSGACSRSPGIPLDVRFRFLDPVDGRAGARGRRPRGGRARRRGRAHRGGARRDRRHLRVGGRARRRGPLPRRVTCPVRPGARSLEVSQDRLTEKETFRRLGIAHARVRARSTTAPASTPRSSRSAVCPRCSRRDAVATTARARRVLATRRRSRRRMGGAGRSVPLILESLVPFDRELSVLAVRGLDGTVACWPLVENHHEGGILRVSRAPAPGVDDALQARGEALAARLLDDLDHVGVLAVELFDVGGELLANEIAPRVHNSGHWTIEGAVTSQFENHVRAVLGWPLGSTAARGPSAMVNCIGVMPTRDAVLAIPGAHLHDYGKSPRPGRKLGHVTVIADRRRRAHRRASTRSLQRRLSSDCIATGDRARRRAARRPRRREKP